MAEPETASPLEAYLRKRRAEKQILLMTHLVIGYPDLDTSFRLVEAMVSAGVDLMELQIPFSEPIADGPVILHANQEALAAGTTVDASFELAEKVAARFDVPFLFMSYFNVLFRRGVVPFAERMRSAKLRGAIVPDLPPEEAGEYLAAMSANALDPIFIFSPTTPAARLARIAKVARGFVYCVARKGVTGSATDFTSELSQYLERARAATSLPLAVGFGVADKKDVDFLRDKADIAVVGTAALRTLSSGGVPAVKRLLEGLR